MKNNRTWLAFANEDVCNHRKALKDLGFVNWTTKIKSKFAKNDIVYLFMSDDRAVRFKLRVAKVNVPRKDDDYWIGDAPKDNTYRLELVGKEYDGNLLNEDVLKRVGFKGGGSILTPSCNNTVLMEYINDVFEIASKKVSLPSHYIVIDLESGSYWKNNTGHEVFNLEPNDVDGRFYGYLPPYDDPNIIQLGALSTDDYVDGVMVVYVKKLPNSSNRQIVAFTDNARVYAESQSGTSLNRFIIDKGKRIECTYTIESDYIYDLRAEPNPFVFDVSGDDLLMFRKQRFYTGRRPRQEVKMLAWLMNYLQGKVQEDDNDLDFQRKIQEAECSITLSETSKQQPTYNDGTSGRTVAKKACISKQAIRAAHYKCAFDETHETFLTNKGVPYMEGHHLIPCTYSNAEYYWSNFKRNIDCVENIVCLCPTCHRRIHFGSKEEKEAIIKSLYKKQISSLKAIGLNISIEELLSLYN
jgi:hypothetical protein